jgi:hypothetical protein
MELETREELLAVRASRLTAAPETAAPQMPMLVFPRSLAPGAAKQIVSPDRMWIASQNDQGLISRGASSTVHDVSVVLQAAGWFSRLRATVVRP